MRKVDDGVVRSFNEICSLFPDDFAVVEIVNVDYSIGQELGRVIGLCDSMDNALDVQFAIDPERTIVIEGLNQMHTLPTAIISSATIGGF